MRSTETCFWRWRFAFLPPWNFASRRPRLPIPCACWMVGRFDAKQRTSLVSDRSHSHRLFSERHWPSHLACCVGLSQGQLDGLAKVESLAFLGSLLRALRAELGRRKGYCTSTLLALRRRLHAERREVSFFFDVALTFSQDSRRVWKSWLPVGLMVFVGKYPTRDSWEHAGAPRPALRGDFRIPPTPGSHRF